MVDFKSTDSVIRFRSNYDNFLIETYTALSNAKRRLNQVKAIIETYQFDSMHFPIEFRSISMRCSPFLPVATLAYWLIAHCSRHQRARRAAISRVVLYQYSRYCSTNERNIFIEYTCNGQSIFREPDFPLHLCPSCRCTFLRI